MSHLSSVGKLDNYLTGNPQITYFKNPYKRYTNFSKQDETIYNFILPLDDNFYIIPKNDADLLNGITLILDLDENINYKEDIDSYILDSA